MKTLLKNKYPHQEYSHQRTGKLFFLPLKAKKNLNILKSMTVGIESFPVLHNFQSTGLLANSVYMSQCPSVCVSMCAVAFIVFLYFFSILIADF